MTKSNDEIRGLVNTIAPALRLICARKGVPARVTFSEKLKGKGFAAFSPSSADPAAIAGKLQRKFAGKAGTLKGINVEGAGSFAVSHPAASGRAAGLVAVVTGAAQGFGLEIAEYMAKEGATVVLADLNTEGAVKAAAKICARHGKQRAAGLALNVTSDKSVSDMVHETVKMYGGFDVFISNAGVLKAGSVKTMPVKDFDFVAEVNYKGYFLCVRNAAPVLAVQHMADRNYFSDIIQINSKSGLEGSNRNAAYAGSKFGGIGLTQSFAMELIEDGIKINSICPGNFFDGPLWSDPHNGLFVQYLRSGKVPGAKTIRDVRKAYETKVPMGRGCMTADVMKAVFYIIDQKYETGQAVPVTGGQVMLK